MYCKKCGAVLNDAEMFCSECGSAQTPEVTFCLKCGSKLKHNAKFCSSCGSVVSDNKTSTSKVNTDDVTTELIVPTTSKLSEHIAPTDISTTTYVSTESKPAESHHTTIFDKEMLLKKIKEALMRYKILVASGIGCILILIIIIFVIALKPSWKYDDAIELMNSGDYAKAISYFEELDDYKDSKKQISECKYRLAAFLYKEEKYEESYKKYNEIIDYKDSKEKGKKSLQDSLYNSDAGDIVKFGVYEQDNNNSNGKEPIEWTIVDRDANDILLVSKYILDVKQFNDRYADIYWEDCSLRAWLNKEFYQDAFTAIDQSIIINSRQDVNYSSYSRIPSTDDNVFILTEYGDTLYQNNAFTKYAEKQKEKNNGINKIWTSSKVYNSNSAVTLDMNGKKEKNRSFGYFSSREYSAGESVDEYCGVRPVVRIRLR